MKKTKGKKVIQVISTFTFQEIKKNYESILKIKTGAATEKVFLLNKKVWKRIY